MKNNLFTLDIFAIPKDEIENWHNSFHLIESPVRLWEMCEEIKEGYYDVIRMYTGTFVGDILIVKVKLYIEYRILLFALRYLQSIEKEKRKVRYSENSLTYKGIVVNGAPYQNSLPYTTLVPTNIFRRVNKKARKIARSIINNNSLFYYFKSVKNDLPVVTLGLSEFERAFLGGLNCSFCMSSDIDWSFLKRPDRLPKHINDGINGATEDIVKKMCEIADKYSIIVGNKVISFMIDITREHLIQTAKDLFTMEKKFASKAPWHILGSTQGTYFYRLISLVNAKFGGKITGFNHGNDVARNRDYRAELSIPNEFVTYTNESVRLINKCNRIFKTFNNNRPRIVSLETDMFYNLWRLNQQMPIPSKIKRVMIISSFYKVDGNLGLGFPDLMNLDMEIRLIRILTKLGYKVIYKAHPDGCNKWINFNDYFGHNVNVIREPFEQVIDKADAILFYYTGTTTFTWALCSNKPVILVYCEFGHRISDEAFELIKKRCRVISGGLDERNRFSFDEEELLEALARKPEEPNTEFIEKYMFPEGIKA